MDIRKEITELLAAGSARIAAEKRHADPHYFAYYADWQDNLFCAMDANSYHSYANGSGSELKARGKAPAKMASIASSSAMTFNLLRNGPVTILPAKGLPAGKYTVQFEKQLCILARGGRPANLDAFLCDDEHRTAIFCEMKMLEWLGQPGLLKDAYLESKRYFQPDATLNARGVNACTVFHNLIKALTDSRPPDAKKPGHLLLHSRFSRYDAWQMFKHSLAIYNCTSRMTQKALDGTATGERRSMAGRFDHIILANIVYEFPPEYAVPLCQDRKFQIIVNSCLCRCWGGRPSSGRETLLVGCGWGQVA